jgi:hypothetical protein
LHRRPHDRSIRLEQTQGRWPRTGFRQVVSLDRRDGPVVFDALRDTPRLAADLSRLIEIYADLLGCPAIGVRLEVLERPMCPAFHIDRTGIRLLCTYLGEGTQWLDDSGLGPDEREMLKTHPSDDRLGQAAPFDILLLKGSLWQNNETRGAIHRSPPMRPDAGVRYLVALDALWTT